MRFSFFIGFLTVVLTFEGYSQRDTTTFIIESLDLSEVGEDDFKFDVEPLPWTSLAFRNVEVVYHSDANHTIFDVIVTSDTNYLRLPLDNLGGVLILKNYKDYDTLRIENFKVYKNCFGHEKHAIQTFNRFKKSGGIDTVYRVERKHEKGIGACDMDTVSNIELLINDRRYMVPLQVTQDNGVMSMKTGHGYIPRRFKKDIKNYRQRVSYFHFREATIQTIYQAELVLE